MYLIHSKNPNPSESDSEIILFGIWYRFYNLIILFWNELRILKYLKLLKSLRANIMVSPTFVNERKFEVENVNAFAQPCVYRTTSWGQYWATTQPFSCSLYLRFPG